MSTAKNVEEVQAHNTIDKVATKAHGAVDRAASAAGAGEEKLHVVAEELSAQAHQMAETAKACSSQVSSAVGDYARENPLKTVGIAFLAGAVVASLLGKK